MPGVHLIGSATTLCVQRGFVIGLVKAVYVTPQSFLAKSDWS